MTHLIGGLFQTQEMANQAYQALQNSGFSSEEISMFVHRPRTGLFAQWISVFKISPRMH
jgi:hypothetical protein